MTSQDLLARAAELAPEWCRNVWDDALNGEYWEIGGMLIRIPCPELILWAVLKECERRGIGVDMNSWEGPPDTYAKQWHVDLHATPHQACEWADDPATAVLGAFVQLLEAEHEVTR